MRPLNVPYHLVGLWASANLVIALAQLGYTRNPVPILLHVGGTLIVATFGLMIGCAVARGAAEPSRRVPYRSVAALSTGVTAFLVAWGVVYGWWIWIFAVVPALSALRLLRSEHLTRAAEAQGADEAAVRRPVPVEREPSTAEVRHRALDIAHARKRHRRGEAT